MFFLLLRADMQANPKIFLTVHKHKLITNNNSRILSGTF
jgi:hypothetical protein